MSGWQAVLLLLPPFVAPAAATAHQTWVCRCVALLWAVATVQLLLPLLPLLLLPPPPPPSLLLLLLTATQPH